MIIFLSVLASAIGFQYVSDIHLLLGFVKSQKIIPIIKKGEFNPKNGQGSSHRCIETGCQN